MNSKKGLAMGPVQKRGLKSEKQGMIMESIFENPGRNFTIRKLENKMNRVFYG